MSGPLPSQDDDNTVGQSFGHLNITDYQSTPRDPIFDCVRE